LKYITYSKWKRDNSCTQAIAMSKRRRWMLTTSTLVKRKRRRTRHMRCCTAVTSARRNAHSLLAHTEATLLTLKRSSVVHMGRAAESS
jgi:hypothetical protein